MPIKKWEHADVPGPLAHVKLSITTKHTRQLQTKAADIQKFEKPAKQVIAPKKQLPEKKPKTPKRVTTASETKTKPVTKQSLPTTRPVAPKTKLTKPKDTAIAGAKTNNVESMLMEETMTDYEVTARQFSTTPPQIPDYLNNPKPFYPVAAKHRGIQGLVLLEVTVSASGATTKVIVKKSSGHKVLDRAASDTVASWQFIPASENGKNIETVVEIPIKFEL
ncbi:MAG: TonB family protein, partial [Gammaproteobacteria bacterium]